MGEADRVVDQVADDLTQSVGVGEDPGPLKQELLRHRGAASSEGCRAKYSRRSAPDPLRVWFRVTASVKKLRPARVGMYFSTVPSPSDMVDAGM